MGFPLTSTNDTHLVPQRLEENVTALPLEDELSELSSSVTTGITVANNNDDDLDSLITRADRMLYAGKRDGRVGKGSLLDAAILLTIRPR
ncbi:diguanylate cyclase domain-containing protein [Idiomarina sp.]|uniref:diguanylate cyclase domain-containing protein n=1 Tax=Idiomarina sp. TaxID=1874361 RepID=UPI003A922630